MNMNSEAGSPDAMRAVRTAEGPGMGITMCSASMAAFTRSPPGSLIRGMPASLTSAIAAPRESIESIWPASPTSLSERSCLKHDMIIEPQQAPWTAVHVHCAHEGSALQLGCRSIQVAFWSGVCPLPAPVLHSEVSEERARRCLPSCQWELQLDTGLNPRACFAVVGPSLTRRSAIAPARMLLLCYQSLSSGCSSEPHKDGNAEDWERRVDKIEGSLAANPSAGSARV